MFYVMQNCKIHHSVVGLRSCISEGAVIEDTLLMGADYYEVKPAVDEICVTYSMTEKKKHHIFLWMSGDKWIFLRSLGILSVQIYVGWMDLTDAFIMIGQTDADRRFLAAKGSVPIGIGKNSHIKRAIIDKNARIGDNVKVRITY